MKNYTLALTTVTALTMARADLLPSALPDLAPFSPGLTELTYHIALTPSQQLKTGDEFVIIDVDNFDHWEIPVGAVFSLTEELVSPFATTFGGGIINPPDDPTKLNLRFTYTDLPTLVGPIPFTPLSGLIFEESFNLLLVPNNFAGHAHQIDPLGGLPTVNVASVYVPRAVPEASTQTAIGGLLAIVGTSVYRRRRSR